MSIRSFFEDYHESLGTKETGLILGMGSANERRRYIVTSSLIGWAHAQNDPKESLSVHVYIKELIQHYFTTDIKSLTLFYWPWFIMNKIALNNFQDENAFLVFFFK